MQQNLYSKCRNFIQGNFQTFFSNTLVGCIRLNVWNVCSLKIRSNCKPLRERNIEKFCDLRGKTFIQLLIKPGCETKSQQNTTLTENNVNTVVRKTMKNGNRKNFQKNVFVLRALIDKLRRLWRARFEAMLLYIKISKKNKIKLLWSGPVIN